MESGYPGLYVAMLEGIVTSLETVCYCNYFNGNLMQIFICTIWRSGDGQIDGDDDDDAAAAAAAADDDDVDEYDENGGGNYDGNDDGAVADPGGAPGCPPPHPPLDNLFFLNHR